MGYLRYLYGGVNMNMLRNITLASILLAVVGNSWATTNLSSVITIPVSGQAELIVFVTPHITEKPIPAICREVEFTTVIADMDGSTPTGTGGVTVGILDSGFDYLAPFMLTPGKLAKITIPNDEPNRINIAVEFLVSPPEAQDTCGPKASASVIDSAGVPIGGPTNLNGQFKAMPNSAILRQRE
jgi:hypothetical protein